MAGMLNTCVSSPAYAPMVTLHYSLVRMRLFEREWVWYLQNLISYKCMHIYKKLLKVSILIENKILSNVVYKFGAETCHSSLSASACPWRALSTAVQLDQPPQANPSLCCPGNMLFLTAWLKENLLALVDSILRWFDASFQYSKC